MTTTNTPAGRTRNFAPLALLLAGFLSGAASAADKPDFDRLGKDLTPVGAERAGNAAGTIPEWTGGLVAPPAGFDPAKGYLNPFADEQPLYVITAANADQYKDTLAPGQLELLKRFDDFKIRVFPSHRTVGYPQAVYDLIKAEAPNAHLSDGGANGIEGVQGVQRTPLAFPIPDKGVEVIWNHAMRYRGGSVERATTSIPVRTNGSFTPIRRTEYLGWSTGMAEAEKNIFFYALLKTTSPSNVAGEAILVQDPLDHSAGSRAAWSYNPGQRRVLRAPEVAYDGPLTNADGLGTTDDYDMYSGAPDRFDWALKGKKEMIVSYNNYDLTDRSLKYSDLVGPQHLNQDKVRYELHRVWVVEATLKPGKRHVYAKRTYYVDEDTWAIAHVDQYDARGDLWRIKEAHQIQYYDAPAPWVAGETFYDLQARRYLANSLAVEERPIKFGVTYPLSFFSTNALRRASN